MIKSVSRSTGLLSSLCLFVALIVPLVQCLPVENDHLMHRFKRNVVSSESKATSTATSNSGSNLFALLKNYGSGGGNSFGGGGNDYGAGIIPGLFEGLPSILEKTTKPITSYLDGGVINPLVEGVDQVVSGLIKTLSGTLMSVDKSVGDPILESVGGLNGGLKGGSGFGKNAALMKYLLPALSSSSAQASSKSVSSASSNSGGMA